MKLLIVTQKVDKNDPILGFFHRWIEEFAKHFEKIIVICLEKGECDLPPNVKVLSLGKEDLKIENWKLKIKFRYILNFYQYIWRERNNYDAVFVHMNPEYVVLGGLFWRVWNKRIGLWYVHRQTNLKLWIAEKFVHVILTSSPESFCLKSRKTMVLGHGIDSKLFRYHGRNFDSPLKLVHVGRITRVKNIHIIFESVRKLLDSGVEVVSMSMIGQPITPDDKKYLVELKALVKNLEIERCVVWRGTVPNSQIPLIYAESSASINASPDGGMDKVVLESLATGCPSFVHNKAFMPLLADMKEVLMFSDASDLATKIASFQVMENKGQVVEELSKKIRSGYDVAVVVDKIIPLLHD